MFKLKEYALVKDNYCINYKGNSAEFVIFLKYLRPHMEKHFPGIQIQISCKKELFFWLDGENNVFIEPKNYGYVRNISDSLKNHTIELFLEESNIPIPKFDIKKQSRKYNRVLISSIGSLPTKNLNNTDKFIRYYKDLGFDVIVNTTEGEEKKNLVEHSDVIIGVESDLLVYGAFIGKEVCLVPTGLGTSFYKSIFKDLTIKL